MGLKEYTRGDASFLDEEVLRIVHVIADQRVTFKTEIEQKTGISEKKVGTILSNLREADVVETVVPHTKKSDQRLLDRRPEMFNRGDTKRGKWQRKSWVGLNNDYVWRFKSSRPFGWWIVNEYHEPKDFALSGDDLDEPFAKVREEDGDFKPVAKFVGEKLQDVP